MHRPDTCSFLILLAGILHFTASFCCTWRSPKVLQLQSSAAKAGRLCCFGMLEAYVGLSRQQRDDVMHERERQRDHLEAATAAADRSVEIAQSYVVPAFERGA